MPHMHDKNMKDQPSHLNTDLTTYPGGTVHKWPGKPGLNKQINHLAKLFSQFYQTTSQSNHITPTCDQSLSQKHDPPSWYVQTKKVMFDLIECWASCSCHFWRFVELITCGQETSGCPGCDTLWSILFLWYRCDWGDWWRRHTLSMNSMNGKIEELTFPVPRRPSTYMQNLSFHGQWVSEPATLGRLWRNVTGFNPSWGTKVHSGRKGH